MRTQKNWIAGLMVTGLVLGFVATKWEREVSMAAEAKSQEKLLVHNVFFSLNDNSPANVQKLIDSCNMYLTGHPGTVYYAAGSLSDLDRPVNDREFDVGLHLIFANRAAHDEYQVAERHLKFIEENKPTWKKVRVFDSDCAAIK